MPDVPQAICIDSEEETPAPRKRRKRRGAALPPLNVCIDVDEDQTAENGKEKAGNSAKAADNATVCLSSDEEAPKSSPKRPPTCKDASKQAVSEASAPVDDTDGLDARAQELAEAALRSLPLEVRASRIAKVKHSILVRLRSQAASECQAHVEPAALACPPQPPPPPPSEAKGVDGVAPEQNLLSQQKRDLQDWVERNQQQLQHKHFQVEQQRLDAEMQRQEGERYRLAQREKRKALWNTGVTEASDGVEREGRLTANGWESSHFQSNKERLKFLRLMGGQKFVDAATSMEGDLDDEKVFELIRGEWVEAKEDEEDDEEEFNIREDAATVELMAGQWVDVQMEPKESACAERAQDLERQYLDGMSRQLGAKRLGLGA